MSYILFQVEYNGKNYSGWQKQPHTNTLQQQLENSFNIILPPPVSVRAFSRTDAGVHSKGQIAFVQVTTAQPINLLMKKICALTPPDITITNIVTTETIQLPIKKKYIYQIYNGPFPPALDKDYFWWIINQLDILKIKEVLQFLVGTYDFSAFRSKNCGSKNTMKTLYEIKVEQQQYGNARKIYIHITGSGFLKSMIRIIVGTAIDIALKKKEKTIFQKVIAQKLPRKYLGMTAPAKGLILEKIYFPKNNTLFL